MHIAQNETNNADSKKIRIIYCMLKRENNQKKTLFNNVIKKIPILHFNLRIKLFESSESNLP
jgi:hypothetical protein